MTEKGGGGGGGDGRGGCCCSSSCPCSAWSVGCGYVLRGKSATTRPFFREPANEPLDRKSSVDRLLTHPICDGHGRGRPRGAAPREGVGEAEGVVDASEEEGRVVLDPEGEVPVGDWLVGWIIGVCSVVGVEERDG